MSSRDLCHDIIFNILLRIPARLVYRFRSVSKQWFHIITDPLFVRAHLAKSKPALLFAAQPLSEQPNNRSSRYRLAEDNGEGGVDVQPLISPSAATTAALGSCNGLVLVRDTMRGRSAAVVNPITGEYSVLPIFACGSVFKVGGGIGFDPRSKEYRVVIFYNYGIGKPFYCKILALKSGAGQMAWKRLKCPFNSFEWFVPPVVAKGSLHWYSYDRTHLIAMDHIGGGDAEAEFRRIDVPADLCKGYRQLMSKGDGVSIAIKYGIESRVHEIWKLEEAENWIHEETIELGPKEDGFASIVGSLGDGKTIILEQRGAMECAALDLRHGKVTRFSMMGEQTVLNFTMAHVSSLASWNDHDRLREAKEETKEGSKLQLSQEQAELLGLI